jgi:hypothetical protein
MFTQVSTDVDVTHYLDRIGVPGRCHRPWRR